MPTFGKRRGGGRRANPRASTPLPAMVTTLRDSQCATLVNASCTGARLRGSDMPAPGEELLIKVGSSQLFATVVWSNADQCGVLFEREIPSGQVELLRREAASSASLTRLSPEEKLALDDWTIGLAR
jgi:hypothetical protein